MLDLLSDSDIVNEPKIDKFCYMSRLSEAIKNWIGRRQKGVEMRKFLPVMTHSLLTRGKLESCISANRRSSYYLMDKGYYSEAIHSLIRE